MKNMPDVLSYVQQRPAILSYMQDKNRMTRADVLSYMQKKTFKALNTIPEEKSAKQKNMSDAEFGFQNTEGHQTYFYKNK